MKKVLSIITAGSLLSICHSATIIDGWDAALDLGLTLTRGNSDTSLFTTNLALTKKVDTSEQLAGLSYAFGGQDGDVVTDELSGFYNFNKLLTNNNYYGFRLEGRRDDIAQIDYRIQATVLYGKYFIKNDDTTFSVEGGPGFTTESFDGEDQNNAHIYIGENYSNKLTSNTTLTQSLATYTDLDDLSGYNFVFSIALETQMNEAMSLKISIQDKYESKPADGAERNDLRLISGISYKF